ncbi:metal ABC transporter substrate-binding protein [Beijerinckia indica]|uniref:Periplasmic solute binding protein n=1 Tax=Beijerinckia indica subsp. indica (strain ATCC 9039 / DSM 1715 / NCIMB 8712) TaxID=395963 RepID=B2IBW5_BEII9|nr:metal ABC transporter substrate-binding protein [Beijerinckia indica]ACB93837.1 periplasmic solute binding protein [Beijerinckia indica subsp. indica ATCC 9039]
MRRHFSRAGLLCALALVSGFAPGVSSAHAKTLRAVASFTILADVVKQVGGDQVTVESLVPPNGDPHEFEPSPDNARALKGADITFISGEGLENWFQRLVKASGYKGAAIVVSNGIKTFTMEEGGERVTDPHVWNSAANVVTWVDNIEKALIAADPEDTQAFHDNANRYRKDLRELDAYAHARIDAVPQEKRKILTSHDAFGYFAKDYGVTFLSPLGFSTETEASAATVAKLIDQIRKEKVKVYFIENSNDPRLVKQIGDATGARPGGTLYVESLSPPDGKAPTYLDMFRNNVNEIAGALSQ